MNIKIQRKKRKSYEMHGSLEGIHLSSIWHSAKVEVPQPVRLWDMKKKLNFVQWPTYVLKNLNLVVMVQFVHQLFWPEIPIKNLSNF